MNTQQSVVTEGRTVEDAVRAALDLLQAAEHEVEVHVEAHPRGGVLGLGRRKARVRVHRVAASPSEDALEEALAEQAALAEQVAADDVPVHEEPSGPIATVSVQGGEVRVNAPEDRPGDPIIRPGEHARVWINDQLATGPQAVTEQDVIRVAPVETAPETIIMVQISEDQFTASISVSLHPGIRYRLIDLPPSPNVTVRAERDEVLPPTIPTVADLESALAERGVVFGISTEALTQIVQQLEQDAMRAQQPVPVAFGVPTKPTVDERIELLFDPSDRVRTELEDHQADLLGLYKLSSVSAGAELGVKHPGTKGTPGRTVTGQEVPVNEPRPTPIKVGDGVAWDDDGKTLIATRGGRPTMARNVISIHSQHTVRGDVDPSTGHIEFDGDVVIGGNVSDSMRVISKGAVSVGNSVSTAVVEADESVTVGRGIVKSKVVAGARYAQLFRPMAFLQPLAQDLRHLVQAITQVTLDPRSGTGDFQRVTVGSLVRRLLDGKFSDVERRIRELRELIQNAGEDRPDNELIDFVDALHKGLVGLGPHSLKDLSDLAHLQERTAAYVDEFNELQTAAFDVTTGFIDNSEVMAGGQIVCRSGGTSYSRLWAGTGVVMDSGVFRGTSITVNNGNVTVKEAGSRTATPAHIEIVHNGEFRARIVHPGVVVTISNQRHTFRHQELNVRVRLVDGELHVRTGA